MCHPSCVRFGESHLCYDEIAGKAVLEVGSLDVNGSLRAYVCSMKPSAYVGVDIQRGPGVDELCDMTRLVERFGRGRFDVVICTEVLEHIRNWRKAVSNLKNVLKPGGILILTARSEGFPYHGFPSDFWRFETDDMNFIFSDMIIESNENDPEIPGVFVKARRPAEFEEKTPDDLELYSIICGRRCPDVNGFHHLTFMMRYLTRRLFTRILPRRVKTFVREISSANRIK